MSHTCIIISVIIQVFIIDSGCVWELFFHVKVEKDAGLLPKLLNQYIQG